MERQISPVNLIFMDKNQKLVDHMNLYLIKSFVGFNHKSMMSKLKIGRGVIGNGRTRHNINISNFEYLVKYISDQFTSELLF